MMSSMDDVRGDVLWPAHGKERKNRLPRDHHQSRYSQSSFVLLANVSLELNYIMEGPCDMLIAKCYLKNANCQMLIAKCQMRDSDGQLYFWYVNQANIW